jgi:hypothetical protein
MAETRTSTPLIEKVRNHIETLRLLPDAARRLSKERIEAAELFADLIIATEPDAQGADREIVTLSILLHNTGSLRNTPKSGSTSFNSALDAKGLLESLQTPRETTVAVFNCIRNQIGHPPSPKVRIQPICTENKVLISAIAASRIAQLNTISSRGTVPTAQHKRLLLRLDEDFNRLGYFKGLQNRFKPIYENLGEVLGRK